MNPEIKSETSGVEILVVEDSPVQAEMLKYLLEGQGYKVTHASNGKLAHSCLNGYRPSLIISDINMPEMNGYELCQRVKSDEALKSIPVILLTSLSDTEDVLEGLVCGADSFITKPYSTEYILTYIQRILDFSPTFLTGPAIASMQIPFAKDQRVITANPQQMLSLLLSTYEAAIQRNNELNAMNEHLENLVDERTSELSAEIMERERLQKELQKLSIHDELTGLLNRRGFMSLAEQHWRLASRVQQEFTLLYMDVNGFKSINDTFGHAQGDVALQDTARALEITFRTSDILGRVGGDEFAIILVDGVLDTAGNSIGRLAEYLNQFNVTHNYSLSVSIGLAQFDPNQPVGLNELLEQADADMYTQKRKRKEV